MEKIRLSKIKKVPLGDCFKITKITNTSSQLLSVLRVTTRLEYNIDSLILNSMPESDVKTSLFLSTLDTKSERKVENLISEISGKVKDVEVKCLKPLVKLSFEGLGICRHDEFLTEVLDKIASFDLNILAQTSSSLKLDLIVEDSELIEGIEF